MINMVIYYVMIEGTPKETNHEGSKNIVLRENENDG